MKRSWLAAAAAHALLLLLLLYLDGRAAEPAELAPARKAVERYEALRREVLARREPEPGERGRPSLLGRRDGMGADWARGASVPQNVDEDVVRDEALAARLTPGRVFLGSPAEVRWSFVDSWYTLGPFPEGSVSHAPEQGVDLDQEYLGASGARLRWRFRQSPRPEVAPETMIPHSVHYASTQLRSDRERAAWLVLGADDSIKVWLNGELVWDCGEHWRAWILDEGAREVRLRQGYNTLLVRLDNWPDVGTFSVLVRTSP